MSNRATWCGRCERESTGACLNALHRMHTCSEWRNEWRCKSRQLCAAHCAILLLIPPQCAVYPSAAANNEACDTHAFSAAIHVHKAARTRTSDTWRGMHAQRVRVPLFKLPSSVHAQMSQRCMRRTALAPTTPLRHLRTHQRGRQQLRGHAGKNARCTRQPPAALASPFIGAVHPACNALPSVAPLPAAPRCPRCS